MIGRLHQINMEYRAVEDRIVLRLNTTDQKEFRLWMTRRFARQLWDALMKIMAQNPGIQKFQDPDAQKAMMAFEQDRVVKKEQFEQKFSENAADFPLGKEPQLLTGFAYHAAAEKNPGRIAFQTQKGADINLPVNDQIVYSMAKMLANIVKQTGWDLKFEIGFGTDESAKPARVH